MDNMIMVVSIIMLQHFQHYHVTGPSVVSSGSRSRTVLRGASRDFHPRPYSEVFVIVPYYDVDPCIFCQIQHYHHLC